MTNHESKETDGGYLLPAYVEEPINKWQAFKQRRFPFWLKRVFPVKTNKIHSSAIIVRIAQAEIKRHLIS